MQNVKIMARMLFQMPHRSIGTKLFLIFFCFLGISIAGMGVFSSGIAKKAIVDQMKKSSQDLVTTAGEKLDMKQDFYVDISSQLLSDRTFTENLFQIANESISKQELQRRTTEMRELFDQLALSDQSIRNITLIPLQDSIEVISTEREDVDANIKQAEWVSKILSANGKPVWMPIEERGYLGHSAKPLFAYGRLFGKSNVGSHDFILLVQIESKVLQSVVDSFKLSENSQTWIADQAGDIILGSNAGSLSQGISMSADSGNFIKTSSNGVEQLVAYRHSALSNWSFAAAAPLSELTKPIAIIQKMTYVFMGLNVFVALVIGMWMVIFVGKPLSHMVKLMNLAASGNLTGRLSHRSRQDEIGQVAQAYDRMMMQIGQLIMDTRQGVNEVTEFSGLMTKAADVTATSAREIHAAAEQIAGGAIGLATNAEAGAHRMEQMGESLAEVLSLQNKMAHSAQEVDGVCRQGGSSVHELLRKAESTEASFRNAALKVNGLQASANSVHSFLKIMKEMAKSTRILSLNASVEATRAGNAGAGFKVISDEIRQLAENTNASIGQVGQLTDSILREVEAVVDAMSQAFPFFQDMNREVHEVYKLFADIQQQMGQLLTRSMDVTISMEQASQVQAVLGQAISEVSAVSQESSAATEQVASLCATQLTIGEQLVELSLKMNQITEKLEKEMAHFQIQ